MSSSLIGGIAGAAVGFLVAGPVGAQAGWIAGSMLGNLLDPPKVKGPELSDLKLQSSTYGKMIPIVYGKMRIAGTVDWIANDGKMVPHKKTSGGKGGGPKVESTNYTAGWSVKYCNNEISAVLKRWSDARVVSGGDSDEEADIPLTTYYGTSDQLPDPTIEADIGAGEVPGNRGYFYEVYGPDVGMEQFGNHLPQMEVLAVTVAPTTSVITLVAQNEDTEWGPTFIPTGPVGLAITEWTTFWDSNQTLANPTGIIATQPYTDIGGGVHKIHAVGTYVYADGSRTDLWYDYTASGEPVGGSGYLYLANGLQQPSGSDFCADAGIPDGEYPHAVSLSPNSRVALVFTSPTDDYTSATIDRWYRIEDGVVTAQGTVDPPLQGIELGLGNRRIYATATVNCLEQNGRYLWMYVGNTSYVPGDKHLRLGWIDDDDNFSILTSAGYGGPLDSSYQSIFSTEDGYCGTIGGAKTSLFTRLKTYDGVTLASIVADLCERSGLSPERFDVSQLAEIMVHGFAVASQMEVRNAIESLRQAYFFDAVETDDVIRFVLRGGSSVAAIPDEDLGAHESGTEPQPLLASTRKQEAELPAMVSVQYYNPKTDYQIGTQTATRLVTSSESVTTISLPIAMSDDEAKWIAERHLFSAWVERDSFTWSTSRKYAYLDPTDVVTIRGIAIRIVEKSESPTGVIKWSGVLSSPHVAGGSEGTIGAGAGGFAPAIPAGPRAKTRAVLLDIPVLSQQDAPFGFYWAACPERAGRWSGSALYKSVDGGDTYAQIAVTNTQDVIGETVGALADYAGDIDDVDTTSSVDVVLASETMTLSSCTDAALDGGVNLCAIRSGSKWELLQFRDAVLIAPRTYTLTNFYRGRKKSPVTGHVAADDFVMLPCVNVDAPESELNVPLKYKTVTFGMTLASADVIDFTNTGESTDEHFSVTTRNLPTPIINVTSTSYTLLAASRNSLITCSNAATVTITLPDNLPKDWKCWVQNIGAGDVVLDPAGSAEIDENGGANLTLKTDQGLMLVFDGTDYYTERGMGTGGSASGAEWYFGVSAPTSGTELDYIGWINTETFALYFWYDDGDSTQWVESRRGAKGADGSDGAPGATGATGPAGPTGATGATGPAGSGGLPGTMSVIEEMVFSGKPTTTFTNAQTYSIGSVTHTASFGSGGGASIVAGGLRLVGGSSSESFFNAAAPSVRDVLGQGNTTAAEARWRRGLWAYWWRVASITLDVSGKYGYSGIVGGYPQHGFHLMLARNLGSPATQNTSAGGTAAGLWWNGTDTLAVANNNAAYDTFCLLFRSPTDVDYLGGSWSSGWPDVEAMDVLARANPSAVGAGLSVRTITAPPRPLNAFSIQICCGANTTMIVDRYRFSMWA